MYVVRYSREWTDGVDEFNSLDEALDFINDNENAGVMVEARSITIEGDSLRAALDFRKEEKND